MKAKHLSWVRDSQVNACVCVSTDTLEHCPVVEITSSVLSELLLDQQKITKTNHPSRRSATEVSSSPREERQVLPRLCAPPSQSQSQQQSKSPPPSPRVSSYMYSRPKIFLSVDGTPAQVGVEELMSLSVTRRRRPPSVVSPRRLEIHQSCDRTREASLMPCHARWGKARDQASHRYLEPIRDRDKRWFQDELTVLTEWHAPLEEVSVSNQMTQSHDAVRVRQERKWKMDHMTPSGVVVVPVEDHHHHVRASSSNTTRSWTIQDQMKLFILRDGRMISSSFAIISIYGLGIHGRIYGTGIRRNRKLILEAYVPETCARYSLELSLDELEDLFSTAHLTELLVAGKKHQVRVVVRWIFNIGHIHQSISNSRTIIAVSPNSVHVVFSISRKRSTAGRGEEAGP